MEIFISWSGARSKQAALLLKDWLPDVIQAIDPFISEQDIEYGARWFNEISVRLSATQRGLICVTPDNTSAPWLMFEAGALAKSMEASRVVPILIGLELSQLPQDSPLSQFQGLVPTRDALWRLMEQINNSQPDRRLTTERLRHAFDANWPRLEDGLNALATSQQSAEPETDQHLEMTAEILGHVRRIVTDVDLLKSRSFLSAAEAKGLIGRAREKAGLRGAASQLPNLLRQPVDLGATRTPGMIDESNVGQYVNALRGLMEPNDDANDLV